MGETLSVSWCRRSARAHGYRYFLKLKRLVAAVKVREEQLSAHVQDGKVGGGSPTPTGNEAGGNPSCLTSSSEQKTANQSKPEKALPIGSTVKARIELLSRELCDLRSQPREILHDREQTVCDELWKILVYEIDCDLDDIPERFSKGWADSAVERFFGTMDHPGHEPGCSTTAAKLFSLYLARKCLVVNRKSDLEKSAKNFLKLVGDPAPHHPFNDRAVCFIARLAKALFTKKRWLDYLKTASAPISQKSCAEKVDKTRAFYGTIERPTPVEFCRVKPILSGGKIRVITLDSYKNLDFHYLNTFMLSSVRSQKWSIAGRSVTEWWDDQEEEWDGLVVSGDLKSATDLFRGEMAEAVFGVLVEQLGLSDEIYKQMMACTTRAELRFGDDVVQQKRGQLMGSQLSFPILCLVSLTAYAVGYDLDYTEAEGPALLKMLNEEEVGVNGDDIVFTADDGGEGWQVGVSAVGGEVSRGKSLCSTWAFTVNSELWIKLDGKWEKAPLIRPSTLLSAMDGRRFWASETHQEYVDCPWLTKDIRAILDVNLRVNLPPSLGGTGSAIGYSLEESCPEVLSDDVMDQMLAWWKGRRCTKTTIIPAGYWTGAALAQREVDRLGAWYLVDKAEYDRLTKIIRAPYIGLPQWTEPDRGKVHRLGGPIDDTTLRLYFSREVYKFHRGLKWLFVPKRCGEVEGDQSKSIPRSCYDIDEEEKYRVEVEESCKRREAQELHQHLSNVSALVRGRRIVGIQRFREDTSVRGRAIVARGVEKMRSWWRG